MIAKNVTRQAREDVEHRGRYRALGRVLAASIAVDKAGGVDPMAALELLGEVHHVEERFGSSASRRVAEPISNGVAS